MLDKSNDNLNNIELMARAKAITDQVLANVVKEQRRDRQIFNYKLDQTKRELYEKYEEVESEV